MLSKIRNLFRKQSMSDLLLAKIRAEAQDTIDDLDFDEPDVRIGVTMYFVLSKQFSLIGKPEGEFPYVPPFASDKARGALLGTAIAIVRREYGYLNQQAIVDAAATAFALAFGPAEASKRAWQTIDDANRGNDDINSVSDWAIKDTAGAIEDNSPATPAAYFLAVDGMI